MAQVSLSLGYKAEIKFVKTGLGVYEKLVQRFKKFSPDKTPPQS